jgi:hypothetical protein
VEQRLDRPEAERFVADLLDQALFVGRREAQVLFLEQRADDAVDLLLRNSFSTFSRLARSRRSMSWR